MSWRAIEKDPLKRNRFTLAATIISCVGLNLSFLVPLVPYDVRIVIVVLYSVVSAWLAYTMEEQPRGVPSLVMASVVPIIFIGWASIHLDLIPASSHSIFFNIPILVLLAAGLLLCRKHGTMRTYMIISS